MRILSNMLPQRAAYCSDSPIRNPRSWPSPRPRWAVCALLKTRNRLVLTPPRKARSVFLAQVRGVSPPSPLTATWRRGACTHSPRWPCRRRTHLPETARLGSVALAIGREVVALPGVVRAGVQGQVCDVEVGILLRAVALEQVLRGAGLHADSRAAVAAHVIGLHRVPVGVHQDDA